MASSPPITELLLAWREGNRAALDELLPLVYSELRRMAHRYVRGEHPGATLDTSGLVNELYLRLVDSNRVQWRDRAHFFAAAAEAMQGETTRQTEPCPRRQARYAELLEIYREIYPQLRQTYRKLARFVAEM